MGTIDLRSSSSLSQASFLRRAQPVCMTRKLNICVGSKRKTQRESWHSRSFQLAQTNSRCIEPLHIGFKPSFERQFLPPRALLTSTDQHTSSKVFGCEEKVGVLLLNLGGPETLEDVQPFLFNLFADPVSGCVITVGSDKE